VCKKLNIKKKGENSEKRNMFAIAAGLFAVPILNEVGNTLENICTFRYSAWIDKSIKNMTDKASLTFLNLELQKARDRRKILVQERKDILLNKRGFELTTGLKSVNVKDKKNDEIITLLNEKILEITERINNRNINFLK
jgi:hypothetical protein